MRRDRIASKRRRPTFAAKRIPARGRCGPALSYNDDFKRRPIDHRAR